MIGESLPTALQTILRRTLWKGKEVEEYCGTPHDASDHSIMVELIPLKFTRVEVGKLQCIAKQSNRRWTGVVVLVVLCLTLGYSSITTTKPPLIGV